MKLNLPATVPIAGRNFRPPQANLRTGFRPPWIADRRQGPGQEANERSHEVRSRGSDLPASDTGTPMDVEVLAASWWSAGAWSWLWRLGVVGLVLLGFADNAPFFSAPPCSVELFVILLCGGHPQSWARYALTASIGEIVGGYVTYRLARAGSRKALEKKIGEAATGKLCGRFEKSAFITVFAGAILPPPFPFTPVLMAAGIMQCPGKTFLCALPAGRGLRYFALAWLSRSYGRQLIAFVSRNYRAAMYTLIALAVLTGIGALIYYGYRRTHKDRRRSAGNTLIDHKG